MAPVIADDRFEMGSTPSRNGVPSFQLERDERYLHGDGLESNRALIIHWRQSAATNRDSHAVKLFSEISR